MACAIKVDNPTRNLLEHVLNTIDKRYSVIITMPNKMSLVRLTLIPSIRQSLYTTLQEKETSLRALGAEVVRTPDDAAWDTPQSHIGNSLPIQYFSRLLRPISRRREKARP